MHKHLMKDGFTAKVLFTVSFLMFIIFSMIYYIVFQEFQMARESELDRYIKLIERSIDEAYAFTDSYEAVLDEKLYHLSQSIRFELEGQHPEDISQAQLRALQQKYELAGLAIFERSGDDIVISNSTLNDEIGTSTKQWGYWFNAFDQLLSGHTVDVNKGFAKKDVWVGPKSLSYYADGYHKYAYIYHPNPDYIINPYIVDDQLANLEAAGNLDKTLEDIKNSLDHVEAIGVVDAAAWKAYKEEDYDGNGDPLVIYGGVMRSTFLNSMYDVDTILNSQEKLTEKLPDGKQMNVYMPIRDQRIVIIRVNSDIFDKLIRNILYVFIGLGFIASGGVLIIAYMLVGNYSTLLDLEKQRLKLANTFRKTVQKLPDMIYHCQLSDTGEILLTYNEGKFFKDQQIILKKEQEVLMDTVYTDAFMAQSREFLLRAFGKERVRFEASIQGKVFDNIVSPVFEEGFDEKTGNVKEIIGFATDISERIKKEQKAQFLAYHDPLTGLPNRMRLKEYLKGLLDDPKISQFYIMYFDLDNFKSINDQAGHGAGDTVLKEVSGRIQALLGEASLVGRMSGDEFVVIVQSENRLDVEKLAKHILSVVEMPIHINNHTFNVRGSIGVAAYPEDAVTFDRLMEAADRAMYESKDLGGNSYQFSDEVHIQ